MTIWADNVACRAHYRYAVDSLILLFQSIIASSAFREFGEEGFVYGLTIAAYVGMLTGFVTPPMRALTPR